MHRDISPHTPTTCASPHDILTRRTVLIKRRIIFSPLQYILGSIFYRAMRVHSAHV